VTTQDNRELPSHEEENETPALCAPIVVAIVGLILAAGMFLVLGTGTGHKHRSSPVPATPVATAPHYPPIISEPPQQSATPITLAVRWHGTVTVNGPDAYKDLDALPPRTNQRDADITGDWLRTTITAGSPDVQIAVLPEDSALPGFKQCRDAAYSNGSDHTEELQTGDVVCVITSQGRVARLKTVRAEQLSLEPVVKFDVTIWDPPAA
jgi:hypothetical protein